MAFQRARHSRFTSEDTQSDLLTFVKEEPRRDRGRGSGSVAYNSAALSHASLGFDRTRPFIASSSAAPLLSSSSTRPVLTLRYGDGHIGGAGAAAHASASSSASAISSTRARTARTTAATATTMGNASPVTKAGSRSRYVDPSAQPVGGAAKAMEPWAFSTPASPPTHHRASQRQHTPEKNRGRASHGTSFADPDSDSYSYSYSYSYTSRSSTRSSSASSASSSPSFIGSRFDAIKPVTSKAGQGRAKEDEEHQQQQQPATKATVGGGDDAGRRRVSFATERTVISRLPGGTADTAKKVTATPAPSVTNGSSPSRVASDTRHSLTPIENEARAESPASHTGHNGSFFTAPAHLLSALLGSRKNRKGNTKGDDGGDRDDGHDEEGLDTDGDGGDDAQASLSRGKENEGLAKPLRTRSSLSTAGSASAIFPLSAASHTTSTAGAAGAAPVSNAARALAVYTRDNQSAAALLRAPPGSVVSALHTVNVVEELARRKSAKALRENVDDAMLDELDGASDDQLLPYPSQLTHHVLPLAPFPAPNQKDAANTANNNTPASAAGIAMPRGPAAPRAVVTGCCITQKRALRRQQKADVRDATRQVVNTCLLRNHHVPLIPFATRRNDADWVASGAPTFAEAAQSRWAHGVMSTAENPKALEKAMGSRSRPGRLAAKTTFAYGRRAGGGPQGGGRSEFLGPNDPVLYWASQLREQTCLRLDPIDTKEVYSYNGDHNAKEEKEKGKDAERPVQEHSHARLTMREQTPRAQAQPPPPLSSRRRRGEEGEETVEETTSSDAVSDSRGAVAAAMAATTSLPRERTVSSMIALTADGSTTIHALSPALLSTRSHDQLSSVVLTPSATESRAHTARRTPLSTREMEARNTAVPLTELSPPRSAVRANAA